MLFYPSVCHGTTTTSHDSAPVASYQQNGCFFARERKTASSNGTVRGGLTTARIHFPRNGPGEMHAPIAVDLTSRSAAHMVEMKLFLVGCLGHREGGRRRWRRAGTARIGAMGGRFGALHGETARRVLDKSRSSQVLKLVALSGEWVLRVGEFKYLLLDLGHRFGGSSAGTLAHGSLLARTTSGTSLRHGWVHEQRYVWPLCRSRSIFPPVSDCFQFEMPWSCMADHESTRLIGTGSCVSSVHVKTTFEYYIFTRTIHR